MPDTEKYKEIAADFERLWQYPHCVGSCDGKHIRVICPRNSGSTYYNYKQYFSIALQGVVDANAYFIAIDVGDYGRHNDSSIFKHSSFGTAVLQKKLPLPAPEPLQNTEDIVPYVFIGDEAYPLLKHFMRPYPRKDLHNRKLIYNYRHSRARRTVECAFGMMAAKFQCLS
mgnify:CR=1 FL=1